MQCKKELLKKSLIYKSRVSLDEHSVVSIEDGKGQSTSILLVSEYEVIMLVVTV